MNPTNEMVNRQLSHRTIREFKQEPLAVEVVDTLFEVARATATSNGMQAFSIIRITDPEIKKKISEVCRQGYVVRAPELMIFIADLYRNERIATEKKCLEESFGNMDFFFQGFTDACLAAQNMVNAAEAMGLGTMYLGSILNDSSAICEILKLPKLTFPVVGLGLGYPAQEPQMKPRMSNKLRVFENSYTGFDSYLDEMRDYDRIMQEYYDLRNSNKRVDSFTDQVVTKIHMNFPNRQEMLNTVKSQGFNLMVK